MGHWVHDWITKETSGHQCTVEFGTMKCDKLCAADTPRKVGIEIYEPYFHYFKNYPQIRPAFGNFIHFEPLVADDECDVAMMIDTLEHVEKKTALDLLKRMQKRFNKILILTPKGYADNTTEQIDGNTYQNHLSGWKVRDFKWLGFKNVQVMDAINHDLDEHGHIIPGTEVKQSYILAVWSKQ